MNSILQWNLIGHVLFGSVGVILLYMVWRDSFKKLLNVKWLQYLSLAGAASFILAWITGGYYYLMYYGSAVKPVIKASAYPWAHSIVTEAKEHVFLLLPLLAVVVAMMWWLLPNEIQQETKLKKAVTGLSGLISLLGIAIMLGGIVISGAVR